MKLLREYIRSLLTEAAKGPEDLPDGATIEIEDTGWGVSIYLHMPHYERAGIVHFTQDPTRNGPCSDAYEVIKSQAPRGGWGPMLYDVAMEHAGATGLMADRRSVSPEAYAVWEFYLNSRPDVRPKQLDIGKHRRNSGFLTPDDPSDDCRQDKFLTKYWVDNPEPFDSQKDKDVEAYLGSPLTKAFVKQGTATTDKLRELGKLKETDKREGKWKNNT